MIVVELMGGLGNQMFQYALGRNLAIKNNTQLYLDKTSLLNRDARKNFIFRNYDLDIFNIEERFLSIENSNKYNAVRSRPKKILNKILPLNELKIIKEKQFGYTIQILNLSDNIYLNGYWQNFRYFSEIENIIKSDFSFKQAISTICESLLNQIKNTESVCLNIRRTDFVTNPTAHGILENDYYIQAEKILLKQLSKPIFYIFSDDIEWCINNIKLESEVVFVDHKYAGNKFRNYLELMSSCKHFVIPNSTFAWWAAWLSTSSRKIVIAPKVWLRSINFETDLMSPSTWIFL